MTFCHRSIILSVAGLCVMASIPGISAQQSYNSIQDYSQTHQQFPQYVQPHQQQFQQPQIQPQNPGKLTGYEAQDLIPQVQSPLAKPDRSQGNPQYVDFINNLYRFDRTKPALQFDSGVNQHQRQKRAIIFRPMFVYKQQKVHKEKVNAEKKAAAAASVAANQSPHYKDKQNNVYKEYNSFYEPYRYGQRYPYRNY